MVDAQDVAVESYLTELRAIGATGAATDESSYYTPLNKLLTSVGGLGGRSRAALGHPKGIEGDFPDVAIYDTRANVLVLPVEVKGQSADISKLAKSAQAKRYAKSFGGGRVLVTNLVSFAVADLDPAADVMIVKDVLDILAEPGNLKTAAPNAGTRLVGMIDAASSVRATISDARYVARLLAYHGARMMDRIRTSGDPQVILAPIRESLHNGLNMDLDDDMLVPTTVQTVLYGLFAAWLEEPDPREFEWLSAAYRLRLPVYAELVHTILSPSIVRTCNLPPLLEDAAKMLAWVDADAFAAAFDGGAIEYFYEPFLAAFDSHLRRELGVWYTPAEIANYQVARVDHHLRADLGLTDGIADTGDLFVLDPACGTGTYLTSVLRAIRQSYLDNGEPEHVASERAADAARTRIIGFEILPAAFVIAHINVSHLLASWGVPLAEDERLRIYLTNSLTGWSSGANHDAVPIEALAAEIAEAQEVKASEPVIAIIGNPPYEGFSAAETDEERELLKTWTEPLLPEFGVRKSRLGDLYVRFWRMAVFKISALTGRGVVSFITNRKWLGGRSYPVMRRDIVRSFGSVIVDDLHGDVHERIKDDGSAFTTKVAAGITVGTAIVTAVRTPTTLSTPTVIRRDFYGSGEAKRIALSEISTSISDADSEAQTVAVSDGTRWRFSAPVGTDSPLLSEYFTYFYSGVQPVRDDAVTDLNRAPLVARMKDYFDYTGQTLETVVAKHPGFGVTRARYDAARVRGALQQLARSFDDDRVVRFEYRPLTRRFLYWETGSKLLNESRNDLFDSWYKVDGQVAIACAQTARRPNGSRPVVTTAVPSYHLTDPDARVFTRLRNYGEASASADGAGLELPTDESAGLHTSIRDEWVDAVIKLGVPGTRDQIGDHVFFALAAVTASPAWAAAQPAQLDDFPTVPLPGDSALLLEASKAGAAYAALCDVDTDVPEVTSGAIRATLKHVGVQTRSGTAVLSAGKRGEAGGFYDPSAQTIWWDREKTGGWTGVTEEMWAFSLGGFPVIAKRLAYSVTTTLSVAEIDQIRLLCRRIAAIIEMHPDLDAYYDLALALPLEIA